MVATSQEALARKHKRLTTDLGYFARHLLKIKTKSGTIESFKFNQAQEFLHAALEKQKRETGRVRALVLKGRQQGCSTYIAGRFYHKAGWERNKNVFILSHEAMTTKKLFGMVERFHNKCHPAARPRADTANTKEYKFTEVDSEYAVGTAGNEDVGRGGTIQLFHGSEVAHWEKTDGIETGIMQSIADIDDTEIVLESTASGMGNMFYRKCRDAIKGIGEYILIFIPWFWQTEYRRKLPEDFVLTDEEAMMKANYGLDDEQINWRRVKIISLGSEWKFKQEYPSFVQEAFQTSGKTLIKAEAVLNARKSNIKDEGAPLIIGVDPARLGDRTILAYRRGRHLIKYKQMTFEVGDPIEMLIAGQIAMDIQNMGPQKVFVDTGNGYGVVDRLNELGFSNIVQGVHFGQKAIEEEIYVNKRAEMWCTFKDWIHGEDGEVRIPDEDELQQDLASMPPEKTTSSSKTQLVSKDIIKEKYGMSPDIGDAVVLTFAYPVARSNNSGAANHKFRKKNPEKSGIGTLQRGFRRSKMSGGKTKSISRQGR